MTLRIRASVDDSAVSGSNAAATITYAAVAGFAHVLGCGITFSYSGTPTGGRLTIEDGSGTVVYDVDISASGAGFIPLDPYKEMTVNTACIIKLYAAGAVIGKLAVLAHWTVPQV